MLCDSFLLLLLARQTRELEETKVGCSSFFKRMTCKASYVLGVRETL